MKTQRYLLQLCACAALGLLLSSRAHTLPVSYLRIVPEAEFLHLELTLNPFELTFVSTVDENKDGELSHQELDKHGEDLAKRVIKALKLTVGSKIVRADTAGVDPDLTGHHVRVRAHYKADARHSPVTLESSLPSITSSSHLIQVTYAHPARKQMAQLDSQSRKATFQPGPTAETQRKPSSTDKHENE